MKSDDVSKSTSNFVATLKDALPSKGDGQQFLTNSSVATRPSKLSVNPSDMAGKLSDFLGGKGQGIPQVANINKSTMAQGVNSNATELVGKIGDVIYAQGKSGAGTNANSSAVSTLKDLRLNLSQLSGAPGMPSKTVSHPSVSEQGGIRDERYAMPPLWDPYWDPPASQ